MLASTTMSQRCKQKTQGQAKKGPSIVPWRDSKCAPRFRLHDPESDFNTTGLSSNIHNNYGFDNSVLKRIIL